MNAYLINTSKLTAVARFADVVAADAAGQKASFAYDVLTEDDELKRYKGKELIALFNNHVDADRQVKKFADRKTALRRIFEAFRAADLPTALAEKKGRKGKKRVKAVTGNAPRPGTKFARALELLLQDKTREEISEVLKKEFPQLRNTGPKFVTWARSQARRKGLLPTEGAAG